MAIAKNPLIHRDQFDRRLNADRKQSLRQSGADFMFCVANPDAPRRRFQRFAEHTAEPGEVALFIFGQDIAQLLDRIGAVCTRNAGIRHGPLTSDPLSDKGVGIFVPAPCFARVDHSGELLFHDAGGFDI